MAATVHSFIKLLLDFYYYLLNKVFVFPSLEKLWVIDLRTFRPYSISINHNAVQATEFRKISPLGITASPQDHIAKGLTLLDPGFRNTAVGESRITHIDGNRGLLQYRQYSISYLVTHHDYEDVVHLLVWGHLPTLDEKLNFRSRVAKQMVPDQSIIRVIQAFSPDAPAYLIVAAGLTAWAASDPDSVPVYRGYSIYEKDSNAVDEGIYRSLAAFATVVAIMACHQQGKPFTPHADPTLSTIENMLIMMGRPHDRQAASALNKLWILFADHEITNSTAAFLNATSCLSDPISACVASVASGNGPLHGGAIDLAYKRFKQMRNKEGVRKHMADVKAKKTRLMGVGHRVYRTIDPRIPHLHSIMADLETNVSQNPLLDVVLEIDRTVAEDPYFTSRKLSINADLYSSFAYAALGFDPRIFTPLAMTARCAGALAHWRESMNQPPCLWRPRQVFTGEVAS
ncbi:citrate synthase [Hypoxylon trugodes]|uniref:citrate synthase n=1 Tax=Hypoxylon trugodes TaxID=326681 RepID=UPI0021960450|nr:citrate synthase [Hypoxylon trugodes]KAI1386457.1 citrate synthase [Hypoxylon trugodes]